MMNLGMAFLDPLTVLPVFITKLGGSAALVGLVSALHGVGWFLPQVLASRLAETRSHVIHQYRIAAGLRVLALTAVVVSVFVLDVSNLPLFLGAFITSMLVAHMAGGMSAVPFLEITAKTIPLTRRGNFFGTRRLIGGIVGIGTGVVVSLVLEQKTRSGWLEGWVFDVFERGVAKLGLMGHEFPGDFGIIFLLGAVFMTLGMIAFSFAGETPAVKVAKPTRFSEHFRAGMKLIRRDQGYRQFYFVRVCWQFTAMALPFYASYAYNELHFSEDSVGLFLSIWVGSGLVSNSIWGWLLDHRGNRIVLLVTAVMSVLPPLVVLYVDRFVVGAGVSVEGWSLVVAIAATFLINGFIRSGRMISNITYLLEFAPEEKRPLYIGFMNSFSFPFMLSPLLGGVIIQFFGNQALFGLAFLFAILNVGLSARLKEPRHEMS